MTDFNFKDFLHFLTSTFVGGLIIGMIYQMMLTFALKNIFKRKL